MAVDLDAELRKRNLPTDADFKDLLWSEIDPTTTFEPDPSGERSQKIVEAIERDEQSVSIRLTQNVVREGEEILFAALGAPGTSFGVESTLAEISFAVAVGQTRSLGRINEKSLITTIALRLVNAQKPARVLQLFATKQSGSSTLSPVYTLTLIDVTPTLLDEALQESQEMATAVRKFFKLLGEDPGILLDAAQRVDWPNLVGAKSIPWATTVTFCTAIPLGPLLPPVGAFLVSGCVSGSATIAVDISNKILKQAAELLLEAVPPRLAANEVALIGKVIDAVNDGISLSQAIISPTDIAGKYKRMCQLASLGFAGAGTVVGRFEKKPGETPLTVVVRMFIDEASRITTIVCQYPRS